MAKHRLPTDDESVYVKMQRAIMIGFARCAVYFLTLPDEKFARAMELIVEVDAANTAEGPMGVSVTHKEILDELARLVDQPDWNRVALRDLRKNPPSE